MGKERFEGQGEGDEVEEHRGAAEHSVEPKAWVEMSRDEQWWLYEYWNARLRRTLQEAEAKCHRVQAPRFRMLPEEVS